MKKISLSFLIFSISIFSTAQGLKKIESLDSFFAGIPLQKSYDKWIEHINIHPYLGIDSVSEKGLYSSFKAGIKNHFPFPDSVKVKILVYSAINIDSSGKFPNDTVKRVSIEALFGSTKKAKKESYTYFNDLKSVLKNYYGTMNDSPFGDAYGFIKGKNRDFPDVMLFRGYLEAQNFYYVMIVCEFQQRLGFKLSVKQ